MVMDLNLSNDHVDHIMVKEDGSLISSYLSNDGNYDVRLKSKTSLDSTIAVDAMNLLYSQQGYTRLHRKILKLEREGWTTNMEYCSPDNRIVLAYDRPQLVVLGCRHRETLETMPYNDMVEWFDDYAVKNVEPDDTEAFINRINDMTGIEGYVISFKNGLKVKCKTDEYVALHSVLTNLTDKKIYELILNNHIDDFLSVINDENLKKDVHDKTQKIRTFIKNISTKIEKFYQENKNKTRKDYAILAQTIFDRNLFSLAMNMFLGKSFSYEQFIIKHYDTFSKFLEED